MRRILCAGGLLALLCPALVEAQLPWGGFAGRPDSWYRGDEAKRVAGNVISWQSPRGGWPKNTDTGARPFAGDPAGISGTFDNGATTGELRFLARMARVNEDDACRRASLKGLDHILEAQYPGGGWPQSHPPGAGYQRRITFNDGCMIGLMELLREAAASPDWAFVDASRREAIGSSLDRGLACILRCQVRIDGRRTVWCAQHDEADCLPRPGRSYELASLCGAESAGILRYLMSLDDPGPEVVRAIHGGVQWYAAARLTGIRVAVAGGDRVVTEDPGAPPLWARFYEIGTNRPIFSGRDGVKKYAMAEIEAERRNGYAWYGTWGLAVADDYARWKDRPSGRPAE